MTARRCALVVDGGAAMPEDLDRGLVVVPQNIMIGGDQFVDDGHTDTYQDFYRRLRSGPAIATSTPAPGAYLEAFRRADADTVLCLTIPARWSGMHAAANLAATMLAEEEGRRRVSVIDTGTAAGGFALVSRFAVAVCASEDVVSVADSRIREACASVRTYGALATLTYVARSGRVPALIAGISNTLHVRPIFRLSGGDTGRVGLARTTSGVIQTLERVAAEQPGSDPQWLLVFHADAPDEAATLTERLLAAGRVVRCDTLPLSPISGAHTGPGTIGFAALAWPGGAPPD